MRATGVDRAEAMGRDPIWKLLFRFSAPTIIAMMVASSYPIVDAIFVGRLGPEALAALAIVFPLTTIIHAIASGTGVGASSLISRRFGAKDAEGANRAAGTTIGITILIGALISAIFLPNLEALLRLFGASGPVLKLADSYMSILIAFAAIAVFQMATGSIIRAEGNPMLPAVVTVVSAITNIILDPVLIFGLGPIPAMGVAGAATATVTARTVGATILIIYLISPRTSFRFRPIYFLPNLKILAEIYRIGVTSISQIAAGSIVMVLVNRIAVSFGFIPLAVLGVVFRTFHFIIMPYSGIGAGMLPLVGANFGAKRIERVGEVVLKAGIACFIWGLLCWLGIMLFPTQIMSIFNSDPNFLEIGTPAIRVFNLLFFAIGVQISSTSFFLGIGKGLPSLVLGLSRQVIFLLPCIFILPRVFGLIGLWATFPVADGLSILLTLFLISMQFRKTGIPFRLRYAA